MADYKIEICANSTESAAYAQQAGAYRVELCAGMSEGGTTPSYGEIHTTREVLTSTKMHVIIRPRGGDFLYTSRELPIMVKDIDTCGAIGVDGVVVGCLTKDGNVDVNMLNELVYKAREYGMSVTFHRAFDVCRNPFEALEAIIEAKCDRILTSGQAMNASEGIPLLTKLVTKAANRIIIMPGSGVNADNIKEIAERTGAREFHLSARSSVRSGMLYHNPNVSMGGVSGVDEYARDVTDVNKVRAALEALK